MKTEFEVVFTNINRHEIVEKIKDLGGNQTKKNTLMKRVVFEIPGETGNSYLRVRDEGNVITTTYKEISNGKLSIQSVKELETIVGNFDNMVNIYRKIGMNEKSYQETYREIWDINGEVEIMIDLWPGLNPYIEIEAESEKLVKKYVDLLGFDYNKGIFGDSFEVYNIELGLSFDEMNSLKEITFESLPKKISGHKIKNL